MCLIQIFNYFYKDYKKGGKMSKNILFVVTNSNGNENIKNTGVYLQEFAEPYLIFNASGYNIDVASLLGGVTPVDENSMSCSNPMEWDDCIKILRETKKLSDLSYLNYDALYFPGGHGPMFDIAYNNEIKNLVEYFYLSKKPIAAICHGVVALLGAKDKKGEYIVKKKKITSFTNKEEHITKLDEFLPFLLETKLIDEGADFKADEPWREHVEEDELLITGQNQNSATLLAEKLIDELE